VIHLRIVAPASLAGRVIDLLERAPAVLNIVRIPDVARRPHGDLILCDVPREDASVLIAELRKLGVDRAGTISVEEIDTAISEAAREAQDVAQGHPSDAVIWEEVETRTSESAELSGSFLAFMVLAMAIAGVGILTDSQILIIGAMIVGPEFGPLAGVCVAVVQRRLQLALRSLRALLVGFPIAIATTFLGTLALRATGTAPDELEGGSHPTTLFISDPNTYSVIVALLAGTAGVLSLSTAKSGALIGVLVSVTTIPAAANVGVAAAYGEWGECRGALEQLLINLGAIVVAGIATLSVQRALFARRAAVSLSSPERAVGRASR
jgi:uncharacterized hydrophobic protein (TIGR00271 family)